MKTFLDAMTPTVHGISAVLTTAKLDIKQPCAEAVYHLAL